MANSKQPKPKYRVLRCTRCGNITQTDDTRSVDKLTDLFEDRCPDPKAPGGYWYCSYEELVPISQIDIAVENERCRMLDLQIPELKKIVKLLTEEKRKKK